MNQNRAILVVVVVLILAGVGYWLYDSVLGDTAPASGPITAIPLATEAPAATEPTTAPAEPTAAIEPTAEPVEPTTAPATEATLTPEAAATPAPANTTGEAPNEVLRYQIIAAESTASFTLTEDLRGQPVTVVGTTNQVAGELAVNPSDLSSAQIGVIQVNARTIATDSGNRDRAIRNFILNTDNYEFITFTPTAIEGLTGSGALNQPFSFTIQGDLTIRDVTRPVVFEATVQADSADRLTGTATTIVKYADYNLQIPDVPFVANVSDDVELKIEFVALPVQ